MPESRQDARSGTRERPACDRGSGVRVALSAQFRIDYADPNAEFHCGWHHDDDHPGHGDVHFKYEHPGLDAPSYEAAAFDSVTPPRILWEALDELFADVLPTHVGPLYDDS